eukprot:2569313-Amphidinium_carterae.1
MAPAPLDLCLRQSGNPFKFAIVDEVHAVIPQSSLRSPSRKALTSMEDIWDPSTSATLFQKLDHDQSIQSKISNT